MSNTNTDFSKKCEILGDLWLNYKEGVDGFEFVHDFIEYNDVGLPLAFCLWQEIVAPTDIATRYINESWELLLEGLSLDDIGFSSLAELLEQGEGLI